MRQHDVRSINDRGVFPVHELGIRLVLRKAGLRLERSGAYYRIFAGAQVLLDPDHRGRLLSFREIEDFATARLVR
jgi:hypothetical protein